MNGRIFSGRSRRHSAVSFGFDTVVILALKGQFNTLGSQSRSARHLHGLLPSTARWLAHCLVAGPLTDSAAKPHCFVIGIFTLSERWARVWRRTLPSSSLRAHRRFGHRHLHRVAPMYKSQEIAHLLSIAADSLECSRFNIVFGILIAYVSNAAASGHRRERLAMDAGVGRFPCCSMPVFCFGLPESPRGCSAERATARPVWSSAAHEPEASKAEIAPRQTRS